VPLLRRCVVPPATVVLRVLATADFESQRVEFRQDARPVFPKGAVMKDPQGSSEGTLPVCDQDTQSNEEKRRKHAGANPPGTSRRTFLGQVGIGGAAAVALAAIPFEPLIEGKHGEA